MQAGVTGATSARSTFWSTRVLGYTAVNSQAAGIVVIVEHSHTESGRSLSNISRTLFKSYIYIYACVCVCICMYMHTIA